MSPPITNFPTGSTARNRKAVPQASPAAAITAKSPSAIGFPSVSKNTDTSPSTRSTTIFCTAGVSRAPISRSAKSRTSLRKFYAAANIATTAASRSFFRRRIHTPSIFPLTSFSKPLMADAVGRSSARTFRAPATKFPRISASSPRPIRKKENIAVLSTPSLQATKTSTPSGPAPTTA